VTLQTIADSVGVTKMTVSNAFSRPDHVSAAVRTRILEVARELGYAGPDASARALATGRTGVVGLLLTDAPEDAFNDDVAVAFVGSVARALTPRSLSMVLLSGHSQDDLLPARDVAMDAAIVYSGSADTTSIDWVVRRRLPLVIVDRPRRPGISSVEIENVDGAAQAARHVVDLGHRRVGIACSWLDAADGLEGPSPEIGRPGHQRDRLRGWIGTLREAGVVPVVTGLPRELTYADAVDVGLSLLLREPRPTAVLCFSDLIASGVLEAAARLGLHVPDDLTVVGFDDSAVAQRTSPQLTTVRQDLDLKGRATVAALFAAMDAAAAGRSGRPRHTTIPTELVVRGSSAPAPGESA
jgi:DNA-binding LacI/PurR family transcriptional regulator